MREKIIILDFGGQYNQLIARRVRELGVYCEILPYDRPITSWLDEALKGIILTGGPNSVYGPSAPGLDPEITRLGVPVLGICYGMRLINQIMGGEARPGRRIRPYLPHMPQRCAVRPRSEKVHGAAEPY